MRCGPSGAGGRRAESGGRPDLRPPTSDAQEPSSAPRFPVPNVSITEAEPARRGYLLLSEKLHPFPALHVQIAEKRFVPAAEGEPGHGGGHADVDAHHAATDAMLEFARGLP